MSNRPTTTATDPKYVVEIASLRFDPKEWAATARRRAASDRRKLVSALGPTPEAMPDSSPQLWVIQFFDEPDSEAIDRYRDDYGLRLSAGLTSLTFIDLMDADTAARLRRDPQIRACIPCWADLKRTRSALFPPGEAEVERIFKLGLVRAPTTGLEPALVGLGFDPEGGPTSHPGGVVLLVRGDAGSDPEDLLLLPEVEWVEEVRPFIATNASSAQVTQGGSAGSTPIWDRGLHGEGQIIGVFDTDLPDLGHDFFRDPAVAAAGPTHRKVLAVRSQPGSPFDGHATRVCGCAAGDDVNAPGAHADRGGAWAAQLVYTDVNPLPATGQIDAQLRSSAGLGARVHTMSAAEPLTDTTKPAPYTADAAAFDGELWRNESLLMVAAVTNTAPCLNQPFGGAPGTAKNPLTVAGTRDSPNQNDFHTGNPGTADGRRKPDLVAVGESVRSSDLTAPGNTATFSSLCGTSFATPHVAAAAALVRQYFMEGWYPKGKKTPADQLTPSGALLKAVLLNATVDLAGVAGYPSAREGWGRLELDRTLHFNGDKLFLRVQDVPHLYGHDTSVPIRAKTFFLNVPKDAKSMKVTLVFNDPAGAVGASDPVVNKLDLVMLEPMRSRWQGWELGYFGNDFSNNKLTVRRPLQTGTTNFPPDPAELKNNVRQVVVDAPVAGRWGLAVFCHKFDKANTPAESRKGRKAQGYAWVARVDLN
jgi:subtilisin family serine protease